VIGSNKKTVWIRMFNGDVVKRHRAKHRVVTIGQRKGNR